MEAKVIHMEDFRRKRAAKLGHVPTGAVCAGGCGNPLDVDQRVAWDPQRKIAYHIECWPLAEGLTQ